MRKAHLLWLLATGAGTNAQVHMQWTTDQGAGVSPSIIGPDGPWQGVIVNVNGQDTAVYPSGSDASQLLTPEVKGLYKPADSKTAVKTGSHRGNADPWFSSVYLNGGFFGFEYYDTMTLKTGPGGVDSLKVNASIIAADDWQEQNEGNASSYMSNTGLLGLGSIKTSAHREDDNRSSLLQQLKTAGKIDRLAFGLHLGSVAQNISGSLILGGYEQNRVLGPVGSFGITEGVPLVFLRDVVMGVEKGNFSSFPASPSASHWVNPTETGQQIAKNVGAAGSAVVIPNPASPYIYLPPGICEGIANNLGLTYRKDIGLYLWNSSRPGSVSDFVNSPSYLAFVFADKTATNITVKVPFKLLNLTLEPPLVTEKVNYFPCKSIDTEYGFWQLGRAFLQAAFLGVDYDNDSLYLAQAPGPALEPSVVQKFDNEAIKSNPSSSFASTWSTSWTEASNNSASDPVKKDNAMRTGGNVGVAVAVVVFVVAALLQ
ncbi:uncharacterized protein CTRU02_204803 [Colletotrichum truncatum]|uniref:Uncharacterized protein n=1 Tax=Colletotrichum truncatum TaxID=5467 RepID=A0ACC3ZD44_COLTU|nr:uncharacterized protein CTRU02_03037 [Colletotrichum truncatum]KAF6797995.1 hypothetical protein CTRU02_03037 [Colletotrichum truncatum]